LVTIDLSLFGELKSHMPTGAVGRRARVEVPDGLDAFGLIEHLGIPFEADEGVIVVSVNDEVTDLRAPIKDGDRVTIFPPLAGG
jgi:molybdopterin converting factor small subunit